MSTHRLRVGTQVWYGGQPTKVQSVQPRPAGALEVVIAGSLEPVTIRGPWDHVVSMLPLVEAAA